MGSKWDSQKISLKEGEEVITDDAEVANILNKHFVNSVRCLAEKSGCSAHVLDINDKKRCLRKYHNPLPASPKYSCYRAKKNPRHIRFHKIFCR